MVLDDVPSISVVFRQILLKYLSSMILLKFLGTIFLLGLLPLRSLYAN